MESVAIAFSGGVDSAFLLYAAAEALGSRVLAITASSCLFPERELEEAKAFCRRHGIRHVIFPSRELEIEGFCRNPPNRCYLCKRDLFEHILFIAKEHQITAVAEGANMDDAGDYRPGLAAIRELGIASPLQDAGLTKAEIRSLSKEFGLSTWEKPSFACLASRFVYGETISREKLQMVDRAEQLLLELGFCQVRVRMHGTIARIELLPQDFDKILNDSVRDLIHTQLKKYGFSYVTLDLMGYRTGSMNETLDK